MLTSPHSVRKTIEEDSTNLQDVTERLEVTQQKDILLKQKLPKINT